MDLPVAIEPVRPRRSIVKEDLGRCDLRWVVTGVAVNARDCCLHVVGRER